MGFFRFFSKMFLHLMGLVVCIKSGVSFWLASKHHPVQTKFSRLVVE